MKQALKKALLRSVSTPIGSSNEISKLVLGRLKYSYGPFLQDARYPGNAKSAICFSIDFDVTDPRRFDANRDGTADILALSEEFRIPMTWAICGESAEKDMKSYGAILDSPVGQEIGIHTYSHLDASVSTSEAFRADIQRCLQVLGLESVPRAFIFPWNRMNHFEVLRGFGFKTFRGPHRAIGMPLMQEGLWNIRPVYYIDQKSSDSIDLMRAFVDLCIERGTVCHFWSHPWSVKGGERTQEMLETLRMLLAYVEGKSKSGVASVQTMGALAAWLDTTAKLRDAQRTVTGVPAIGDTP